MVCCDSFFRWIKLRQINIWNNSTSRVRLGITGPSAAVPRSITMIYNAAAIAGLKCGDADETRRRLCGASFLYVDTGHIRAKIALRWHRPPIHDSKDRAFLSFCCWAELVGGLWDGQAYSKSGYNSGRPTERRKIDEWSSSGSLLSIKISVDLCPLTGAVTRRTHCLGAQSYRATTAAQRSVASLGVGRGNSLGDTIQGLTP